MSGKLAEPIIMNYRLRRRRRRPFSGGAQATFDVLARARASIKLAQFDCLFTMQMAAAAIMITCPPARPSGWLAACPLARLTGSRLERYRLTGGRVKAAPASTSPATSARPEAIQRLERRPFSEPERPEVSIRGAPRRHVGRARKQRLREMPPRRKEDAGRGGGARLELKLFVAQLFFEAELKNSAAGNRISSSSSSSSCHFRATYCATVPLRRRRPRRRSRGRLHQWL